MSVETHLPAQSSVPSMSKPTLSVGILSMGFYLPDGVETGEEIAKQAQLPVDVVKNKMGIHRKFRADDDLLPSRMAIEAGKIALDGLDPLSIDVVIWTGSEYKDHIVWTAGIYMQRELGLKNAYAFDVGARCSNTILGLHLAKSLMMSDESIQRILLIGGHKTSELVNYQDPNTKFLYNLSDGGQAIVLEKNGPNPIHHSSFVSDGDYSLDVIIPGGGAKNPWRKSPSILDSYLQVPDADGMRQRLEKNSISNFIKVIKDVATSPANKFIKRPINFLSLLHMKKSAHNEILKILELSDDQSVYLENFGHFGALDQILSVLLAEDRGSIKPNDHIVLASAGIGYMWSAISLTYEKPFLRKELFQQCIR